MEKRWRENRMLKNDIARKKRDRPIPEALVPAIRNNVAGEDRTHDLRIMRPTRCQLRYCHSPKLYVLRTGKRTA